MAGITQVWGYKFGCVWSDISPYSNGAVQIRVGLELADSMIILKEDSCKIFEDLSDLRLIPFTRNLN